MTARLGIVSKSGSIRFESLDINECRAFLEQHGLQCKPAGWQGFHTRGAIWHNSITLRDGSLSADSKRGWTASYWRD